MRNLLALLALLPAIASAAIPLVWSEIDVDPTPINGLRYPSIKLSLPEVSNRNSASNLSAPGRLMYRSERGSMRVLYDCAGRACVPVDARVSFDGKKVAATLYYSDALAPMLGEGNAMQRLNGVNGGATVIVVDIETGAVTEWPRTPGIYNVTPAWINQGGKVRIMFSSDRAREYEPALPGGVSPDGKPNLQTYIADVDGSNAVRVGPHDMTSAYGGYQLKDGRVIYSCAQWNHDLTYREYRSKINFPATIMNMWWICASDPWGGSIESPFGAHSHQAAMHWTQQAKDGRMLIGHYYRGNNNQGAGDILAFQPQGFTIEGRPASEATRPFDQALIPRDLSKVFQWSTFEDRASNLVGGRYIGKTRDPFGLPDGRIGFAWCQGVCNAQFGASASTHNWTVERATVPGGTELGIYASPGGDVALNEPLIDRPNVAEFGAAYAGPYADVYGQPMPDTVAQPKSDDGACYLQIASQQSDTTPYGERVYGNQDLSPLMGKELTAAKDSDVRFIRISGLIPEKKKRVAFNTPSVIWGHRSVWYGDAPVQADGSARIKIPCDEPFVLSGVNAAGQVIKRDMMPQSLRPGTTLTCGGCHLHNDKTPQPDYAKSLAARLPAVDLTTPTPQPEYWADVAPIIERRCASCHATQAPAFSDPMKIVYDYSQSTNPNPVKVRTTAGKETWLDRPYTSWLVSGLSSAESPLLWYVAGRRLDNFSNAGRANDYDMKDHPSVGATPAEQRMVALWIDQGAYIDAKKATPPVTLPPALEPPVVVPPVVEPPIEPPVVTPPERMQIRIQVICEAGRGCWVEGTE